MLLEGLGGMRLVDVAQGDEVLAGDPLDIGGATTPDADAGDVQLAVGGCAAQRTAVRQEDQPGAGPGGVAEEGSAGQCTVHRMPLLLVLRNDRIDGNHGTTGAQAGQARIRTDCRPGSLQKGTLELCVPVANATPDCYGTVAECR